MGRMKSTETTSLLSLRSIDRGYANSLCYDTSNEICYICLQISVTYKQNRFAIVVSMEILWYYLFVICFHRNKRARGFSVFWIVITYGQKKKKKMKKEKSSQTRVGYRSEFRDNRHLYNVINYKVTDRQMGQHRARIVSARFPFLFSLLFLFPSGNAVR